VCNVYLPCKSTHNSDDVFIDTIASIINIANSIQFQCAVVAGDFNVNLRGNSKLTECIIELCGML
jgi:hypothetical protein